MPMIYFYYVFNFFRMGGSAEETKRVFPQKPAPSVWNLQASPVGIRGAAPSDREVGDEGHVGGEVRRPRVDGLRGGRWERGG